MQVRSLGQEDSPEKEMATHSSILAWETPWTEEPGWLQSMGSQRVRHDLATEQQQGEKKWVARNDSWEYMYQPRTSEDIIHTEAPGDAAEYYPVAKEMGETMSAHVHVHPHELSNVNQRRKDQAVKQWHMAEGQ